MVQLPTGIGCRKRLAIASWKGVVEIAANQQCVLPGLLQQLGGGTVIEPVLTGLDKPAQIVQPNATVSEIVTAAGLDSIR